MHDQPPLACLSGDRLQLWSEYAAELRLPGLSALAQIPEGYSWDGASIPRWAWSIMGHPLEGDLRLPSLVHDWLCEHSETAADRMVADAVFFLLLSRAGLPRWRRICLWAAVRFYAIFIWRRRR